MEGNREPITIDSMFAAHPEIAERAAAKRERNAEIGRNLFGDPDEQRAVSEFLRDALGYDPPVIYRKA